MFLFSSGESLKKTPGLGELVGRVIRFRPNLFQDIEFKCSKLNWIEIVEPLYLQFREANLPIVREVRIFGTWGSTTLLPEHC